MIKNIAILENNILATNTIRKKLTESLMLHGYDVTILTTGAEDELQQARERGIRVIDVKSGSENPLEILKYGRNLRKALVLSQAQLCLTFTIRPTIWGNFISRYLKIPVISNITGIGPLFESETFSYRVAKLLYSLSLKRTKTVFFQNEDDKNIFLANRFVNENQIKVIPGSGVDTSYFVPINVEVEQPFTFLFIGRLIKDKGILEYVQASKQVRLKKKETVFKIVGPFWHQNLKSNTISQTELSSWINDGAIEYVGNADDVRPHISRADCVVLPSYREGMSNVLLEAGSMEKPCITTDVTGCRDIVEDNVTGLLCQPRNADDLAAKMVQMIELDKETRAEMGRNARIKIKNQFEKEIVIDAYLNEIAKI